MSPKCIFRGGRRFWPGIAGSPEWAFLKLTAEVSFCSLVEMEFDLLTFWLSYVVVFPKAWRRVLPLGSLELFS